ncbi:MMPL family protein [Fontimonas thermophila]|uniref:MMPL family protein n=1 Tax=Fontimonas thermophila TaxID=1076937 RepID=A0A1I2J851_9GAMM|nr:efflux RND transporter permease subunit [Fontimonas thermophila]SFF50529.1 MMPL family protein [Fontimonas thermophila]
MAGAAISGPITERILRVVEPIVYGRRHLTHAILIALTAFFLVQTFRLEPDAGWLKSVPLNHPYMQKFREYYRDFGGANTVLFALIQKEGDIYNPHFMDILQKATDDVFFTPGVDRARVMSLFTPNVNYVENVEGGLSGATVIPPDYQPTPEMLEKVRSNVAKAQVIGRLVTNDQRGAMIMAELLEIDPRTGEKLDYREVGNYLEQLRAKYEKDGITVHIIGFAKIVDDMTKASLEIAAFFGLTLVITGILLWLYCGSFVLGLIPLGSSIIAVIWEMGLLRTLGYGLDPFAILVPFLILAVSVSHGVQYVNAWVDEIHAGRSNYDASLETFRRLAIAGTIALATDVAGFATIYLIEIQIIREMSINAVLGGLAIIVANKLFVPIWLTMIRIKNVDAFIARQNKRDAVLDKAWWWMSGVTRTPVAAAVIVVCAIVAGWSFWAAKDLKIGDALKGVPEFRPDSRFNQDFNAITDNFQIAVDIFKVIAETRPNGCIDYELMEQVDRFAWQMENTAGVQSTLSLLTFAKLVYQGLSEGRLNALVLPRNQYALAQATALVPTSTGLLNDDCDALAVFMFTKDHRAETISHIVDEVKKFNAANREDFFARHPEVTPEYCDRKYAAFQAYKKAHARVFELVDQSGIDAEAQRAASAERDRLLAEYEAFDQNCPVNFALATGNVGVMAATNEVVKDKESEIVLWVYAVILVLLWLSFRDWRAIACIVIPLALVSQLGYGVMATLDIGMKVATLPVLALAVGIGVDYGIYVYGVMISALNEGKSLRQAYYETLRSTGKAVIFTGATLGASVLTWLISELQFQIDMGRLLLFMFTANMLGAIFVLPAIASFLYPHAPRDQAQPAGDRPAS